MQQFERIVSLAIFICARNFVVGVENNEVESHTHFRSGLSDVYIVPNFLPLELAEKWRDELTNIWKNTTKIIETRDQEKICTRPDHDCAMDESSTFYYATNNNGNVKSSSNAKFRSLERINGRKDIAQEMYASRLFSYAKWELHPSHPLVKEIEEYMASTDTTERIQKVINKRQPDVQLSSELSDLFVTLFHKGDFLSPHNDGGSGTFAFVLSLMDGEGEWDIEKYGGGLRFQCEAAGPGEFTGWCTTLKPSFRSLVLFQTRVEAPDMSGIVPGPYHEVLSVNDAAEENGFYRYGFTGWYQAESDVMTEHARLVRDQMRARD